MVSARTPSEARYQAIVTSALDATIVIDDTGRIREFNPARVHPSVVDKTPQAR
ncbi:MAG: PAS domain S-box protein [Pseudoxanthomonas sp.]